MRVEWRPCRHITYISDEGDPDDWEYLGIECPQCGAMGTNIVNGIPDWP